MLVVPAAQAQAPGLTMLTQLESGRWQLRDRDDGAVASRCVADGRGLLQIQHEHAQCAHYVIEDGAASVTVQYSCPGAGYGRTTIRRETGRLVQIATQGVANGAPFATSIEARRVGPCT
ncbi:MAG: DUF3617 domain-containing protein [Sphingopyxis sp.]